jgi:hypothetical protein
VGYRRIGLAKRAVLLAGVASLAIAGTASAQVYYPNTGAVGALYTSYTLDGIAGFQMLSPLTPQAGYFIAHPAQLNPSFSSDFLGFGTAKGIGVDNCPTYTGSGWQVYVDGNVYGTYFCSALEYIAGNAQSQSIIMQRHSGSCPYDTGPGWDVKWQGAILTCITESFSYDDNLSAGAENGGSYPNQPLAITWVQMQYRRAGYSYAYWPGHTNSTDSPYQILTYRGRADSYKITP